MKTRISDSIAWLVLLLVLFSTGCVRNRTLNENERMLPSHPITRTEALKKLEAISRAVQSFRAPVVLDASIGGLTTDKVKQYPQLYGTLLFQSPNKIRVQGKFATIDAFDMVSDGTQYKVLIPHGNKLFEGREQGPPVGPIFPDDLYNLLADLRPKQIKSALLVDILPYLGNREVRSATEILPMPKDRRRYYVVDFINVASADAQIIEKIWIDLSDPKLEIARKQIFGKDGEIETDAHFSAYKPIGSGTFSFPTVIDIQFPDKDISLRVGIQDPEKIALNGDMPADLFQLPPHPNAEVVPLTPKQVAK